MKKFTLIFTLSILSVMVLAACAPAAQPAVMEKDEAPANDAQDMEGQAPEAASAQDNSSMEEQSEMAGPAWYGWELTDVNSGSVFKVADYQGKVVLVETLAVWCSNCLKQQQEVLKLHELVGEREDFVSLGIDIDPNEDSTVLANYTRQNGFDWVYTVAPAELVNEISSLYGSQYLNPPSTPMLVIDRAGNPHLLPFGIKKADELLKALEPFLNES